MVRRVWTSWATLDEEALLITRDDLRWWLDLEPELDWQFATTYAEGAPHEYVVADKTTPVMGKDGRSVTLEENLKALSDHLGLPYRELPLR